MKIVAHAVLAGLCVSAVGCYPAPGAPLLVVEPAAPGFFDTAGLVWMHPTGEATGGYAVEMRRVPGDFAVVATASPRDLQYDYTFDPEAPEVTDFEFRVRALPDEEGTRRSGPVVYHRGVRAPVLSCENSFGGCVPINGAFRLNWEQTSKVADRITLERIVQPINGPGISTVLPVSFPATSYADADIAAWSGGTRFIYSITGAKGADVSTASTTETAFGH
jgi:hypothetical protein